MKVRELFEGKTTDANYKQLVNDIKKNCKRNFNAIASKHVKPFYRGVGGLKYKPVTYNNSGGDIDYVNVPPRTEARGSRTGENLILSYVTQADAWKDIPRRNYSTMCAKKERTASAFAASTFIVFPYDNVKSFAEMPKDFNYTVPTGTKIDLTDQGSFILRMMGQVAGDAVLSATEKKVFKKRMNDFWTLDELKALNDGIQKYLDKHKKDGFQSLQEMNKNVMWCVNNFLRVCPKGVTHWFNTVVTPAKMKIKVVNDITELKMSGENPEIWFEGGWIGIMSDFPDNELFTSPWFEKLVKDVNK
jgi:hypothetical protein